MNKYGVTRQTDTRQTLADIDRQQAVTRQTPTDTRHTPTDTRQSPGRHLPDTRQTPTDTRQTPTDTRQSPGRHLPDTRQTPRDTRQTPTDTRQTPGRYHQAWLARQSKFKETFQHLMIPEFQTSNNSTSDISMLLSNVKYDNGILSCMSM